MLEIFIPAVKYSSKILSRNALICCPIFQQRRKNLRIVSPHISCRSDVPLSTVKWNPLEKYWFRLQTFEPKQRSVTDLRAKFPALGQWVSTVILLSLAPNAETVRFRAQQKLFPDTDHQFADKVLESLYSAFSHKQQRRQKKPKLCERQQTKKEEESSRGEWN